jgi:hypothetical protein
VPIVAHPFWYFADVDLSLAGVSLPPVTVTRLVKTGYNYLLHGFLVSVPDNVAHADVSPLIKIQLIQTSRGVTIHTQDTPAVLFSSPGQKEPGNQDQPILYWYPYNYLFSYSDIVQFKVSGQIAGSPDSCRIVVVGRNIPHVNN